MRLQESLGSLLTDGCYHIGKLGILAARLQERPFRDFDAVRRPLGGALCD